MALLYYIPEHALSNTKYVYSVGIVSIPSHLPKPAAPRIFPPNPDKGDVGGVMAGGTGQGDPETGFPGRFSPAT